MSVRDQRPNAVSNETDGRNDSGGSHLGDRERTTDVLDVFSSAGLFSSYQRGWAEVGQHNLRY